MSFFNPKFAVAFSPRLVTCSETKAVYFLGNDGKRWIFPNEKTYFTWYENFDKVETISCAELAIYPLGRVITNQAGTRLVKITSIPKVYAVEPNGILRWITTEEQAAKLYGTNWNQRVDDVPDGFWTVYTEGSPLADAEYPKGTVLKESDDSYYFVEGSLKRNVAKSLLGNLLQKSALVDIGNLQKGVELDETSWANLHEIGEAVDLVKPAEPNAFAAPDAAPTVSAPETTPGLNDNANPQDSLSAKPQKTVIAGVKTIYDDTVWPTGSKIMSSPFGPRLKASDDYRYDFHRGIDIPGTLGEAVNSIADGEIYRTYEENEPGNPYPSGGTVVVVRHTDDQPIIFHGVAYTQYYSVYMHLKEITVAKAESGGPYQAIKKGEKLGTLGHSGETDFDHVHFEIRIGTTCSLDYQKANPETSCAKFFSEPTDPHVNPLLFLDYTDSNSLDLEIMQTNSLNVLVKSKELDFNEIRVFAEGKERRIDFNERYNIDHENMDNPTYQNITITPEKFNSQSSEYKINFEFIGSPEPEKIQIRDIWGQGIEWKK